MKDMEVKIEEHFVDQPTIHGTVRRSLNQHKVYLLNDETGKYTHCGYVGVHAFLPLAGFPPELLEDVTQLCRQKLNRPELYAGRPPLSADKLQAILDEATTTTDEDEFDDE